MSKKVLITGGAGFIGSNLCGKLLLAGYEVTVLDNLSPQIHGADGDSDTYRSIKKDVRMIIGDVRNPDDWQKALADNEIVVHLAAETGTGQSMYEIRRYTDTNIGGTATLLDFLANGKTQVKKVVVASSRAIYGEGKNNCAIHGIVYPDSRTEHDLKNGDFGVKCPSCGKTVEFLPTDELSYIHPSSIYGLTKFSQEEMVMITCRSLKIPYVAFRYQNVYGPGQSLSNPYTGILSIFSNLIRNKKSLKIFEDGKESRDFVFISDVIDATFAGIDSDKADYETFNVGSGEPSSVYDVATTLMSQFPNHVPIEINGAFRLGDIRHNCADLTKIKTMLGFQPKVRFQDGVKLFTDWVRGQPLSIDSYDKSLSEMELKGLYKKAGDAPIPITTQS